MHAGKKKQVEINKLADIQKKRGALFFFNKKKCKSMIAFITSKAYDP